MPDLAATIRAALDAYDKEADAEKLEQRLEAIEETRGRDFSKDELKKILGELDDDDRDEIVEALVGPERFASMREAEQEPATSQEPVQDDDEPITPPATTRPGRKTGNAYDWDVDDDGRVVELDIARVYSGEDEDDEVELPTALDDDADADAA